MGVARKRKIALDAIGWQLELRLGPRFVFMAVALQSDVSSEVGASQAPSPPLSLDAVLEQTRRVSSS